MKKTILSLTILVMSVTEHSIAQQCPLGSQPILATTQDLTAGNWCLLTGTSYSGNINSISSSAVIYVQNNATFSPGNMNGGVYGTWNVYGTCTLPSTTVYGNVNITNYGTFTFNGVTVNGTNIQIANAGNFTFGGNLNYNSGYIRVDNRRYSIMRFNQALPIGDNSIVDNSGTLLVTGDLNVNYANSAFYNRTGATTRVTTNFNPKGTAQNDGLMVVSALTNVNTPTSFTNNCRFVSATGFVIDGSSTVNNNGLIWAPGGQVTVNSSSILQLGSRSITRGTDFSNNAKVNGSGKMYFTGNTTNQGAQFAGTSAAAPITFYDVSQTGTQIFDNQPSLPTNTVRTVFTPADTSTNNFDCTGLVLPVQLNGFDVQNIQNRLVLVSWQSQTELNLQKFVVERSASPINSNWETIGTVTAAGNSNTSRSYQFTDTKPLSGTSYYRLRSVDADGKELVSNIRQVNLDSKSGSSLQVYPTVVPKGSFVKIITTEAVHYQLLDMSGKTIQSGFFVNGANTLTLNINAGSYIIETLKASNIRQHSKLIVQ